MNLRSTGDGTRSPSYTLDPDRSLRPPEAPVWDCERMMRAFGITILRTPYVFRGRWFLDKHYIIT